MKKIVLAVLVLALLVAAGVFINNKNSEKSGGVSSTSESKQESVKPVEKALTEIDKLRNRVQGRWDAVVADDFHKVYEFATPAYRKSFDKTHFFNQYGGQILKTKAKIVKLNISETDPNEARATVELFFQTDDYSGSSFEQDTWKKVDGEWWYVEKR